ncbi:MAG: phosphoglycerate dehydrogenase [Acidobacteriota bacterium]
MYRILVSDPLQATGLAMLREAGHEVIEVGPEDKPRLAELLADADALVVRSGTKVTAELLAAGTKLKVVGRAGIGVDNVDIPAATERGILVVNAPTANLISATEHTFALLLALARRVAEADASMKASRWDRKAFVGVELQHKVLGVIGFGRIGQAVAKRAQAFDMEVLAYDPFLDERAARRAGAEPVTLDDLLSRADVVTLHTPLTDDTRNLIDAERLAQMKQGALLINCGRGGVVDEAALLAALESGQIGGAGLDVFAQEPPTDYDLASHPRVVGTPHLGASTKEAQLRISTDTARMVVKALDGSLAVTAVNQPVRPAGAPSEPDLRHAQRHGHNACGLLDGAPTAVTVEQWGLDDALEVPVMIAALKGVLAPHLGEAVNYVNAEKIATERGLKVQRVRHSDDADYPELVRVRITSADHAVTLSGTLSLGQDPRIVQVDDYRVEFRPKDILLVVRNRDVPGVVGKVGTYLGDAGVNIAEIHLARHPGSHRALAVVRVDQKPNDAVLEALRALEPVEDLRLVVLG